MTATSPDLIVVREYLSEIPARMASEVLKQGGIYVIVETDDCGGQRPHFQFTTGVKLLIRKQDKIQAETTLVEIGM
jgi:hypothetical protein